ncbi:MAG: hypothetical protein WDZ70_01190 [Candidatus Paceibacterota bacterium]
MTFYKKKISLEIERASGETNDSEEAMYICTSCNQPVDITTGDECKTHGENIRKAYIGELISFLLTPEALKRTEEAEERKRERRARRREQQQIEKVQTQQRLSPEERERRRRRSSAQLNTAIKERKESERERIQRIMAKSRSFP